MIPSPLPARRRRSTSARLPIARTLLAASLLASAALAGAPVIPAPGQTVTWTLAMSPVTFSGTSTIPVGATVIVEPGVTLFFNNFSRLYVDGALTAAGTEAQPIVIDGQPAGWLVARGDVELVHCTIDNTISQGTNSRLHIADSHFTAQAATVVDDISGPVRAVVERCTSEMQLFRFTGEVLVRDVEVLGGGADFGGYVAFDNLVSHDGPVRIFREHQSTLVEKITVTGAPDGGLVLDGNNDYFIDPSVTLTGNGYPVRLQGAGLVPGSSVPLTGNVNDAVRGFGNAGNIDGVLTLPDLGLPYHFLDPVDVSARLAIEPGTTLKMGPSGRLLLMDDFFRNGGAVRGLPGQPITIESLVPGQQWFAFGGNGGTWLFEHLDIGGAGIGVTAPQASVFVNESTIRDCAHGMEPSGLGHVTVSGTRFLGNEVGAQGDMSVLSNGLDLTGFARPNVFAGNGVGVKKGNGSSQSIPARGNWWNHASGPFSATLNPGGLGDEAGFGVDFLQWLAAEPDLSDLPPVLRVDDPFFLADPGDVVLLEWTAEDDDALVSFDVLMDVKGGGTYDFQPVATGLAAGTRSFAFVMPDIGFNTFARPVLVRVVATDSAGQTSFDEVALHVTSSDYTGTFTLNTDLSGVWEPLERFKICWSAFGVPGSLRVYIVLDADERMDIGPAGNAGDNCTFSDFIIPYVSTDSARLAIFSDANGNVDEWYFSEPFTIRPDGLFGDAAPLVTMLTPTAGQAFASGSTLDVTWTASDDDPLRAFKVQVSSNGGRTWSTVARDLPGTATSFSWPIPAGLEASDVRVQVVAIDRTFQNSSDGRDVQVSIGAASPWTDLGHALAGVAGAPLLTGEGTLAAGSPTLLALSSGPRLGSTWLVLGLGQLDAPFKGGVLVPSPDVVLGGLPLGAAGELDIAFAWGAGVPSGTSLFWQHWMPDAAGPAGFSASNGLRSTVP